MFTVTDLAIISITSLSMFFDIKERRIPNWLIVLGLVIGFSLSGFRGLDAFYISVLGFVLGIGVFIIPFGLGWMGAGDVKYFGVIGVLFGPALLPRVLYYSIVAAGLMAVVYTITGRFSFTFFKTAWADCKLTLLSLGRVLPEPINLKVSKGAHSVPWGVAFGVGTILAYYIDPTGRWSRF